MIKEFDSVIFNEEDHRYFSNNKQVGASVTGLIHSYSQEFDEETMAERVANKRGVSIDEILDEWRFKRDYSCIKGNEIHKFSQSLWQCNDYVTDYEAIDSRFVKQLKIDLEILKPQAIAFYEEYKNMLELVRDEQYIYDDDYDIAGSIDLLCKNKLTGQYVIVDFKSNDNFYKPAFGTMKVPLQNLEDDNISHYSLQLEIYKQIFEKNVKEKVEDTFIVYFNLKADTFEIIEPLNVKKEAKKILENRRIKGMESLGVLIQGNSGTGKSASLRNLFTEDYANETAIINVTNKPMPFRTKNNDLKVVNCSDYIQMIKAIIATKKRIVVVDDSSYMLTFENFDKATTKGYDKFTTMAVNYYDLLKTPQSCNGEKIIYFITHEEIDENGISHPKSIGKMLSQQLVIEGLFSIVLRTLNKNGEYVFQTHNDGTSVCKTPMDMFKDDFINNDITEVDKVIREYYGFKPITEKLKEETKEGDK